MHIAGIFLIDCRLTSKVEYLETLNQLLFNFWYKFPDAYVSIMMFDTKQDYLCHFEKLKQAPHLLQTTPIKSAAIFDSVKKSIQGAERLLPIYDIQKVHVLIASLPKDTASKEMNVMQTQQLIQTKKDQGWHFYFPFSSFESLSKDVAFYDETR